MQRVGLVRKTGEFRPDSTDMLQPLYQMVPEDELDETAKAYASLMREGHLPEDLHLRLCPLLNAIPSWIPHIMIRYKGCVNAEVPAY
jgi:hypothetical protein